MALIVNSAYCTMRCCKMAKFENMIERGLRQANLLVAKPKSVEEFSVILASFRLLPILPFLYLYRV